MKNKILQKTIINILFSLCLEVVSALSNFILPLLIIRSFGSATNGLIHSINGYLGYVAILQLGAGSVIKAALYKPLVKKNTDELGTIVRTSNSFFTRIGLIGVAYAIALALILPHTIATEYAFFYTFYLTIVIAIGNIGQYLLGMTYQMVLEADQKSYIYSLVQITTIVLNTIVSILLIKYGFSVHAVKFIGSLFFLLRPFVIMVYVKRKYSISFFGEKNKDFISQRWDGFAHGLAHYIHSKTDVFVLSTFSTLKNVSIYSVYGTITAGLDSTITRIDVSVRSALGNITAMENHERLKNAFNIYNTLMHILSTVVFSTAIVTASSFVALYTNRVTDANYVQPLFSFLIIFAELIYCLRMPYNSVIFVNNMFKETKIGSFIETGINIVVSIIFVFKFGLIGVAVGTIAAMLFKTVYFVVFLKKNILFLSFGSQIKRYFITMLTVLLSVFPFFFVDFSASNYLQWILFALFVFIYSFLVTIAANIVLDDKNVFALFRKVVKK